MYLTLVPVILMLLPTDGDSLRSNGTCESPQYLKLYTKGTINCFFQDFFGVTWYNTSKYSENSPILDYHNMVKNGTGYESGEFDIHPNGSLIINNVLPYHEVFTVAYKRTKTEVPIFKHIRVIGVVLPIPVFPLVTGCNDQQVCVLEAKPEGNLTCMVRGIRPYVRLEWRAFNKGNYTAITFTNQQLAFTDNGETFDVTLTAMYRFRDEFNEKILVECMVSGSVDAFIPLSSQVYLISVQGNQVYSSASVSYMPWAIPVIAVLVCILFALSGILIKKYFQERRGLKTTGDKVDEAMQPLMTAMFETKLPIVEESYSPSVSALNVKKMLFIKQLQEHYEDLYEAIQPVPYDKDTFYTVDSVFVEGGITFLDSKTQGARKRWVTLDSYKNIFDDPRVKSKRRIFESDPGCGKSTLTLKVSYDWCTSTSVLKDIEILILLRLSQLGGITSIYSAIKETILPSDSTLNESDITDIINECNSLLIIMDEFDKFPDNQNDNSDINNIIANQMFREVEVIITTRTLHLPKKYPPGTTRIRLTGFNDDARRCYIRKAVTMNDEDDARNVEEYLQQYPLLHDLCHTTPWFVLFAHTKYETDHGEYFNFASSYSSENIVEYLNGLNYSDKLASLCILGLTERTENIQEPIRQLCDESIIISGSDELLLQRLCVQLLERAATIKIPVRSAQLHNCLQSIELAPPSIKTTSGLVVTSKIPVKKLSVSLYNRDMTKDEAIDILHFASMCPSLRRLEFSGSVPPQSFKVDSTLATLKSRNVTVKWVMFSDEPWYSLNLDTGRWQRDDNGEEPTSANFEEMRSEFTKSMPTQLDENFQKGQIKRIRGNLRKDAEERRKNNPA